jgi:glycosyltransferase involved in cell wall biosynthesis
MNEFFLSIIIPTWMRCGSLMRLVDSLLNQTLDRNLFELIIIDSKSSDGTKQKLYDKIKLSKDLNIKFLDCQINRPSNKRNLGIRSAQGKWIIFIDDDCEVTSDYLELYYNKINKLNSSKIILCGDVRYPEDWINKSNYFRYRDSRHYSVNKNNRPFDYKTITTMNMAINASELNCNNLFFDENYIFSCEDSDFGYQLTLFGFTYQYCNARVLHYESCGSLSAYAKKIEKISSQGFKLIFNKYPEAAKKMSWYFLEPKPGYMGHLIFRLKKLLLNRFLKTLLIKFIDRTDSIDLLYSEYLFKFTIACCYINGVSDD